MNSLIDCIFFPVKENYNDKYDKIYLNIIKLLLNILSVNIFALNEISYKTAFDHMSKMHSSSRTLMCKTAVKNVLIRLFETLTQRLKLLNNIFNKQTNPTCYFYSHYTK
jgi:hypothetical protein